jgi:hypothetical protein
LPTTTAVEKEIAAQAAQCIKPGNLLHFSRGVRATASPGYFAPWFQQYYYYAINGITDDTGWYVTHGKLPQWLELTLPQTEKIARVVVYSPNLQDFDLHFFDPQAGTRRAEIRGNTSEVAVYNFDPPVPALKLRITALSTREGADPAAAMVREIEAYSTQDKGVVIPVKKPSTPSMATRTSSLSASARRMAASGGHRFNSAPGPERRMVLPDTPFSFGPTFPAGKSRKATPAPR